MNSIRIFEITIILLLGFVNGDTIRLGKCPNITAQKDFQNRMFSGTWYEIARNPMFIFVNTKCNMMNFQLKGAIYNVKSSFMHKSLGRNVTVESKAYSNEPNEPSKLTISYGMDYLKINLTIPYWIIYTDYDTALVWSCTEYMKIFKMFHNEYFWILSRTSTLSSDKLQELLQILNNYGINTLSNSLTEQENCYH